MNHWAVFIIGFIVGFLSGLPSLIRERRARKQAQSIQDWGTLEDLAPKEKP